MDRPRVTSADAAYFRRLAEEHVAAATCDPAGSLAEVLRRIETMKSRLGMLANSGRPLPADVDDEELGAIVARWRGRRPRAR